MSETEIATALYYIPDMSKFPDVIVLLTIRHHLAESLRKRMLYPSDEEESWASIPLRYIWCDMSVWEMPWGFWKFKEELESARAAGHPFRPTSVFRARGCNHFVSDRNIAR
jgi:hypothetical protein